MRRFNNQKKKLSMTIALVLIVFVGLAYAFLNEKLIINSIVSYDSIKWDVGFTAAEDGVNAIVDLYIEFLEKEEGKTLEELGFTREEVEEEMFSEDVTVNTSTAIISEDKKTLNVDCKLQNSLKNQLCFVNATISNASLLNVALSKTPMIVYDDTYIEEAALLWFDYRWFPITETTVELSKGQSLDSGESAEVLFVVITKALTEENLPKDKVSIPITISLEFEEASTPISQMAMVTYQKDNFAFWKDDYRNKIKNITFQDKINIPENAIESWDISFGQNSKVMSYVVPNGNDSTYYDLYIQSDTQLYANFNMSNWFRDFFYLDSINYLSLLDTSYAHDMTSMFSRTGYNSTVFTLDVSDFDTSNVKYMNDMFAQTGYSNLTFTLDVSNFDTSNVIDMSYMFSQTGYNSTVFALDVSDFDTSNVKYMYEMFSQTGYSNLTFTLDVSGFDTSKVIDMGSMFYQTGYNSTVFTLDVSNFDTSSVTNMNFMFSQTGYNSTVFTLNVSNFDTSQVTNMDYMFEGTGYNSTKLYTSITIRNPNVSYSSMFNGVATKEGTQITVNYTSDTETIIDNIIDTKSTGSNVVRGSLVE